MMEGEEGDREKEGRVKSIRAINGYMSTELRGHFAYLSCI